MSDHKMTTEHRRLAIVKHLSRAAGYTSNGSILLDVMNGVGVPTSQDQLITAMAWLDEQELAVMTDHGDFVVITATARGVEVAEGRATHPGVKRPSAR